MFASFARSTPGPHEAANGEVEADEHYERDSPLIALGRAVRDDKHDRGGYTFGTHPRKRAQNSSCRVAAPLLAPLHTTVIWLHQDEIVAAFPATSTQPQAPPLPGRGFLLLRRLVPLRGRVGANAGTTDQEVLQDVLAICSLERMLADETLHRGSRR